MSQRRSPRSPVRRSPVAARCRAGTRCARKPCFAASAQALLAVGHWPDLAREPSSPKAMRLACESVGRDGSTSAASSAGRSAAVSAMRIPPTMLTNTSRSSHRDAAVPVQHREQAARDGCGSSPTATRRRIAQVALVDQRLNLRRSSGRPTFPCVTRHDAARDRLLVAREKDRRRVAHLAQPLFVIANTPISFAAPKRFLTARAIAIAASDIALEVQHGVDHVLRARAVRRWRPPSSTCPMRNTAVPLCLAKRDEARGRFAQLPDTRRATSLSSSV